MHDLRTLANELGAIVDRATPIPLTGSVAIDREAVYDVLDVLRAFLPLAIKEQRVFHQAREIEGDPPLGEPSDPAAMLVAMDRIDDLIHSASGVPLSSTNVAVRRDALAELLDPLRAMLVALGDELDAYRGIFPDAGPLPAVGPLALLPLIDELDTLARRGGEGVDPARLRKIAGELRDRVRGAYRDEPEEPAAIEDLRELLDELDALAAQGKPVRFVGKVSIDGDAFRAVRARAFDALWGTLRLIRRFARKRMTDGDSPLRPLTDGGEVAGALDRLDRLLTEGELGFFMPRAQPRVDPAALRSALAEARAILVPLAEELADYRSIYPGLEQELNTAPRVLLLPLVDELDTLASAADPVPPERVADVARRLRDAMALIDDQ